MQKAKRASMDFSLSWQSRYAAHSEIFHLEKVDFWRDIFPGRLGEKAERLAPGESCDETFEAGTLVPPFTESRIVEFKSELFTPPEPVRGSAPLSRGRILPKGYAWKPLNTFPEDRTPFRLVRLEDGRMVADTNHPLAAYRLTVGVTMGQAGNAGPQRGGSLNDIADIITTNGPGYQVCPPEYIQDVYQNYPFTRASGGEDKDFYSQPRLVHHIDAAAQGHVQSLYGRILKPGMRVLDFMASWNSHLPEPLSDCTVEGLGLNEQELQRNNRLSSYTIQDLNTDTNLPFGTGTFDAVICTVSVEYLLRPREIMDELHRIIAPGGLLAITVSDRWFPGKEIVPWKDLHPFERQGLILRYFLFHENFQYISTESVRGYPRPIDDRYRDQLPWSDPVYAVWGYAVK